MENQLLRKYTYFLGKTDREVGGMSYEGRRLNFMGKDELGYGMFEKCYNIDRNKIFLLHFDRDFGNKCTVQKTYWDGSSVYKELQELSLIRSNYLPNVQTGGFCVHTEQFGQVLFELVPDGDMICVMTSINVD